MVARSVQDTDPTPSCSTQDLAPRRSDFLPREDHIEIDERFYRPAEVQLLQGSYDKSRRVVGWEHKCSFETLVRQMVDADLRAET